jgi:iron complex outermembrane receptor protein
VQNLITSQPVDPALPGDSPTRYVNVDSLEARGVELELEGRWHGGLEARASYTFQRAEASDTGSSLSNSPEHLAKLNLVLPLWQNLLFAGLEQQYQSSRLTLAGAGTGAAHLTNLTLFSRGIVPGLHLSASVYNLFDRHAADPGTPNQIQDRIVQDGRSFRVKLDYRF